MKNLKLINLDEAKKDVIDLTNSDLNGRIVKLWSHSEEKVIKVKIGRDYDLEDLLSSLKNIEMDMEDFSKQTTNGKINMIENASEKFELI